MGGDSGKGDLMGILKQQIRIQKQERELKCDSLVLGVTLISTTELCEALREPCSDHRIHLRTMQPRSPASHREVLPEMISRGFSGA